MSDTNITTSSGGAGNVWGSGTSETTGTDQSQKAASTSKDAALTTDSINRDSTFQGVGIFVYTTESNRPLLPEATMFVVDPSVFENAAEQPAAANEEATPEMRFAEKFSMNMDKLLQTLDMDQLANEMGGLTQEQMDNKIRFLFNFPQLSTNNKLFKIVEQLKTQTSQQVADEFNLPEGWKPNVDTQGQKELLTFEFNSRLQNLLNKSPNSNKLLFAYNHPEIAGTLNPEIKVQLMGIVKEVMTEMESLYGVSSDFTVPPDGEVLEAKMTVAYSDTFETILDNKDDISKEDKALLKAMHYRPDLEFSPDARVKKLFDQVQQQAQQQVNGQFGAPKDFELKPMTMLFNAVANGKFRDTFAKVLKKLDIPQDIKAEVKQLLANPEAAVSDKAREIFQKIYDKALPAIREKMGLEGTGWVPTQLVSDPDPNYAEGVKVHERALEYGMETYHEAQKAVSQLPDSDPNKVILLDFLKAIGKALSIAQQMLYMIQTGDSKTAKVLAMIQRETQLNKIKSEQESIDAQRKEQEKQAKQQEQGKGGFMGIIQKIMKVLAPIMIVLAVIVAPMAFVFLPVAMTTMALFATTVADSAMSFNGQPGVWDKAYKAIEKTIDQMIPESFPPELTLIYKAMAKVVLVVAVTAAYGVMGPVGAMLAADVLVDQLMKSNALGDTFKAMHIPPKVAMALTIIIIVMIILATIVIQVAVTSFIPGMGPTASIMNGAKSVALGAKTAAQAAIAAVKAALQALATQGPKALLEIAKSAAQATAKAAQVTAQAAQKLAVEAGRAAASAVTNAPRTIADKAKSAGQSMVTMGKNLKEVARNAQAVADDAAKLAREASDVARLAAKGNLDDAPALMQKLKDISAKAQNLAMKAERLENAAKVDDLSNVQKLQNSLKKMFDSTKGVRKNMERVKTVVDVGKELAIGGAKAASKYREMQYHLEMADLALMMGRLEAYAKEVDALILLLKQIIQTLLEGLEGIAGDIAQISKMLVGMHRQMSRAMTGISLATG